MAEQNNAPKDTFVRELFATVMETRRGDMPTKERLVELWKLTQAIPDTDRDKDRAEFAVVMLQDIENDVPGARSLDDVIEILNGLRGIQ